MRRLRKPRRTDPTIPPRVLVMTMVRDEAEMLPRWVAHYAAQVGMENLLVLDDNSTDGSTDDLPCTVHRIPPLPGETYERARMALMSGLAAGFVAVYDAVVLADADEFLLPDPTRHADLPAFLAARPGRDVIAPMALNVVHVPAEEGPLRPGEPVLGQRHYAKFTRVMCKPAITRVPAEWRWGSHGIRAPFAVDDELFMLHLKFADRDRLAQVSAHRRALVDADGRAGDSNWGVSVDEMLDTFDAATTGVPLDAVPEFDPAGADLAAVVEQQGVWYRTTGRGQLGALRHQPLRRVPSRLLGAV